MVSVVFCLSVPFIRKKKGKFRIRLRFVTEVQLCLAAFRLPLHRDKPAHHPFFCTRLYKCQEFGVFHRLQIKRTLQLLRQQFAGKLQQAGPRRNRLGWEMGLIDRMVRIGTQPAAGTVFPSFFSSSISSAFRYLSRPIHGCFSLSILYGEKFVSTL